MQCNNNEGKCNGLAAALFNSVQAGIIVVDADTKAITDINPSACIMIGVCAEEVIGKYCSEYLCVESCDGCPVMTTNLMEEIEDVEEKEIVIHRKDGSDVYSLLTINSMIIDDKRLFINSLIDITKLRKVEKKLEESWSMAGKLLEDNIIKLKNGGS